jgi:hypothetical protein
MSHLLLSDVDGPEPCGVEVGVTDWIDGVFELAVEAAEGVFDDFPCPRNALHFLFDPSVDDVIEGTKDGGVAGIIRLVGFEEAEAEVNVEVQGFDFGADDLQIGEFNFFDFLFTWEFLEVNPALRVLCVGFENVFDGFTAFDRAIGGEGTAG